MRHTLIRRLLRVWLWAGGLLARLFGRVQAYSVLWLRLAGEVKEEESFSLWEPLDSGKNNLLDLLTLLRWAREDEKLRAVVVSLADLEAGWSQIQSLRRSLRALREAGKKVWVYLTEAGMPEYYLATVADKIFLAPAGHLSITGLALEVTFFKEALDRWGIKAQVSQVGEYKAAGEPWTRREMSPAHREMVGFILDDLYTQILEGLSQGRGKGKAEMRTLVDQGLFLAREAQACGLVDGLCYEDEMHRALEEEIGPCQVIEDERYRRQRGREVKKRLLKEGAEWVGLLLVQGVLKQGETPSGPQNGTAVGAKSFAEDLGRLREDPEVKAIVVRINSPGGSGLASDLMWRELLRTRNHKPVIVSMGDLAASGGYYLAMAADRVLAEEGTLTGSIGVVAGKIALQGLYEHLGLSKEVMTRGQRAALFSTYLPWTPPEHERIAFEARSFYEDFVQKVATCRKLSPEAVEKSAQGRLWTGRQAWSRGLVDGIGGLEEALLEAKQRAGLAPHRPVALVRYPKPHRFWRLLPRIPLLFRNQSGGGLKPGREKVWALLPFSLRFL